MISLQTNVDSLVAQRNLGNDNSFQSSTIQQLTSGYRINKSGDDAAGLAIANQYNATVAELNQGVNNANNGVSQLQIVDGGLSNISTILNRLKTLATESASSTFTGSRSTLNDEYASLVTEVTRQATNINLNAGGDFNQLLNVFVGGGANTADSSVSVDLSGTQNAVDATSLGLASTNVLNGGVGFASNTTRLDANGAVFLASSASEAFTFNLAGGAKTTVTVLGSAGGVSEADVISQLNTGLSQYGISASVDGSGLLQFSGAAAFTVTDSGTSGPASGPALISNTTTTAENTSNYIVQGTAAYATSSAAETLTIQAATGTISVPLAADTSLDSAVAQINAATAPDGVYAVLNPQGTGIEFQSANSFSVNSNLAGVTMQDASLHTASKPTADSGTTNNAAAAITAIDSAIATLGLVQGKVGAGENLLNYATSLAQSQISGFSAAESQIKDADVAAQAANLTKSQVLTQTAVAALAQANSEPQAILKLLQ